jgi:hypothetical protein
MRRKMLNLGHPSCTLGKEHHEMYLYARQILVIIEECHSAIVKILSLGSILSIAGALEIGYS